MNIVNNKFKIPIYYNEQVKMLNDNVINELELVETIDKDETSVYDNVFKPSSKPATQIIKQVAKYYTTDTEYLKQTQQLTTNLNENVDELNTIYNKHGMNCFDIDEIVSSWEDIIRETSFCEKYLYIDWSFAKFLNNSPQFLQIMSLYNIVSPIISLCLPIIILIVPFIIIKIKGIELGLKQYIDILKTLISNHSIFKMFTQFHEVNNSQKIYLLVSSAFYLFSIYQNILVCVRFYSNMQKIQNYLIKFKQYMAYTLEAMSYYSCLTDKLTTYNKFNIVLEQNRCTLSKFYYRIKEIVDSFSNPFQKMTKIGDTMSAFYQLNDCNELKDSIAYSFGFNGYLNILSRIGSLSSSKLNKTRFIKKGKPIFKNMYYPKYINEENDIIRNSCDLNKNMIITGPNASGKTTTIKSILINILLSQQIGFGCFDSIKLTPYDKIHCYLNIPDTSGRDSLFQAEARRCKDIIDSIDNDDKDVTHFCIFDELYSGTNPDEAVASAHAFMDYIVKRENVTSILTTHYIKLCKKMEKNDKIQNCHMKTKKNGDNFEYTYKLKSGISKIKGGLKVLYDMNYPKEILDLAKE